MNQSHSRRRVGNQQKCISHLASDFRLEFRPSEIFLYGQHIRGMKPEVPGARPEPLQPGVTYRLFVKSGSATGQHDFQPVAK